MATTIKITTRLGRRDIKELIESLPATLSGGKHSKVTSKVLRNKFWSLFVQNFMTELHDAFMVRSRGGADETGLKWKPLSRKTIAYGRPIKQGDLPRRSAGRTRGILTKQQDRIWRGIFRSFFTDRAKDLGVQEARVQAAKLAWAIVKKNYGAETKIDKLGSRKVLMLIKSHKLEKSLRAGRSSSRGKYLPYNRSQKVDITPGKITITPEIEYAGYQHRTRRLWPSAKKMEPWVVSSTAKATVTLKEMFEL